MLLLFFLWADGLAFQDFLKDVKRLLKSRNDQSESVKEQSDTLSLIVNKLNLGDEDEEKSEKKEKKKQITL